MTAKDLSMLLSAAFDCDVVAVQDPRDVVCPLALLLADPSRFATGSHLVIAKGDNIAASSIDTTNNGRADEREAQRYWLATREADRDTDDDDDEDDEDDYSDSSSSDDEKVYNAYFEFEGGPVTIAEARDVMGIEAFSPAFLIDFLIEQRDGSEDEQATWLISNHEFEVALAQLSGARTIPVRAQLDYIMDSIFSVFEEAGTSTCDLRELGCGLMLFCGGEIIDRAQMAYNLVAEADDEDEDDAGRYHYEKDGVTREMMVTAIASLLKVVGVLNSAYLNSCDPIETAEDITNRAFLRAKVRLVGDKTRTPANVMTSFCPPSLGASGGR